MHWRKRCKNTLFRESKKRKNAIKVYKKFNHNNLVINILKNITK